MRKIYSVTEFQFGEKVLINQGPHKGMTGIVTDKSSNCLVIKLSEDSKTVCVPSHGDVEKLS